MYPLHHSHILLRNKDKYKDYLSLFPGVHNILCFLLSYKIFDLCTENPKVIIPKFNKS